MALLLIVLTVAVLAACCWANGSGFGALSEPVAAMGAVFLLVVSALPLLRRVLPKIQGHYSAAMLLEPAVGGLLLWNTAGAIPALMVIASAIGAKLYFGGLLEYPVAPLFGIWCLVEPFTTAGIVALLWSRRKELAGKLLMLYAMTVLGLWLILVGMFLAFAVIPVR